MFVLLMGSACAVVGFWASSVILLVYDELTVIDGCEDTVMSPKLCIDISLGMVGQRVVESSSSEDTGVVGRQRDAPSDDIGDVGAVTACDTWLLISSDEVSESIPWRMGMVWDCRSSDVVVGVG